MIDSLQDLSIARWMMAATAFSTFLAIGAYATERMQRLTGRSTRGSWSAALVVSTTWPIIAFLVLTQAASPITADIGLPVAIHVVAEQVQDASSLTQRIGDWWRSHGDNALLIGWAVLTAVLSLQTLRALWQLQRAAKFAVPAELLGESVLVSEAIGPAVFGVWRPRVLVPRWVLDLDDSLQALVLRHEREHCEGRDSWLVWLALLTTTLMPWNVAMWFMAHRLRLAMEVDCDARTLRAFPDRKTAYARLLLFIAQRATPVRIAPALVHLPSHLARRITAMTKAPSARPVLQRAAAVSVLAISVIAACSRQVAGNLAGPATTQGNAANATIANATIANATTATRSAPTSDATGSPTTSPLPITVATTRTTKAATISPLDSATRANLPWFEFQVDQTARMKAGTKGPKYPEALREAKIEGDVLAQFVVLTDGTVDMSTLKILKSDRDEFAESLREALATVEYEPARAQGRTVKQVVQQPFSWRLSRSSGDHNESPAAKSVVAGKR